MLEHDDESMFVDGLVTTYTPTKQEIGWLRESLAGFYDEQWFTDVLYQARGGKEATVYCCTGGESARMPLVAAKVYRPRMFRAMRNDWFYKQGRTAVDRDGKAVYRGKDLNVVKRNTRISRQIHTASWCQFEFETIEKLHAAGADVPRPLTHGENAILMEFIGDETGAAPVLHAVDLDRAEAHELFHRLIRNIELMLAMDVIHGDLSAHNVLYHDGRAVIIDLPQAVHPQKHPSAFSLLHRDVERICQYFRKQGVESDPMAIAEQLWRGLVDGLR